MGGPCPEFALECDDSRPWCASRQATPACVHGSNRAADTVCHQHRNAVGHLYPSSQSRLPEDDDVGLWRLLVAALSAYNDARTVDLTHADQPWPIHADRLCHRVPGIPASGAAAP
jgi:hypothetical protein